MDLDELRDRCAAAHARAAELRDEAERMTAATLGTRRLNRARMVGRREMLERGERRRRAAARPPSRRTARA